MFILTVTDIGVIVLKASQRMVAEDLNNALRKVRLLKNLTAFAFNKDQTGEPHIVLNKARNLMRNLRCRPSCHTLFQPNAIIAL